MCCKHVRLSDAVFRIICRHFCALKPFVVCVSLLLIAGNSNKTCHSSQMKRVYASRGTCNKFAKPYEDCTRCSFPLHVLNIFSKFTSGIIATLKCDYNEWDWARGNGSKIKMQTKEFKMPQTFKSSLTHTRALAPKPTIYSSEKFAEILVCLRIACRWLCNAKCFACYFCVIAEHLTLAEWCFPKMFFAVHILHAECLV